MIINIIKFNMNFRIYIVMIFLLVIKTKLYVIEGFVMECPYYQLNFQKIIGYRPPEYQLKPTNVIKTSSNDNKSNNNDSLNMNCLKFCQSDENCIAYVYLLNKNQCYGFTRLENSYKYETIQSNIQLEPDSNAIFYEKTCLLVPPECKTKFWPITKIPGSSLIFQGKKTISSLITKRECIERCLFETEFKCLSASFTPSYKNNQARFQGTSRLQNLGSCVLNDKDKINQPAAYKSGLIDEEYIENQCIDRLIENISCSYELFSNSSFILPEILYNGLTQAQCQQNCSKETRFYCQGATYIPADLSIETTAQQQISSQCFLHSEDLISMGPRSLQHKQNSLYLRRVKCLNISVECNNQEMIINYTPDDYWFRGKLYVSSHLADCSVTAKNGIITGKRNTILRLAIGNEQIENKCGILRAYQVSSTTKRTFISTLLVIQNNPNVQTQGDRIIKVGCIISTPIMIDEIERIPDALALESFWNQNNTLIANENVTKLLNTNDSLKNSITMQIIDVTNRFQTNDVEIGQNLELRIIEHPINQHYDIHVKSLIAKSNEQSYELIDVDGCPIDTAIFPKFQRIIVNDMKVLRSNFNAFKFAGTSQVHFDAIIQFCLLQCPILNCNYNQTMKQQRNKRTTKDIDDNEYTNMNNEAVQVKNILYVTSVNKNKRIEANGTEMAKLELPLSLNINVHEPTWDGKEGLAYGDNGLILASDLGNNTNDNLCINQSLLVAIIIFGAIIQIIILYICGYFIMRYKRLASLQEDKNSLHTIHENLSYIDGSRRVRWADNSGFTF